MSADAWDHILDPGETILWQGQPEPGISTRRATPIQIVFGFIFVAFSTFWMWQAAKAGGFFWMFGLVFFFVGVFNAGGYMFWDAYCRSLTWYTLTSKRAFIATQLPFKGRNLKSYTIKSDSVLNFQDGASASIYFARDYRRTKNGSRQVDVGFERIKDGAELYAKFRAVQRGDYENAV